MRCRGIQNNHWAQFSSATFGVKVPLSITKKKKKNAESLQKSVPSYCVSEQLQIRISFLSSTMENYSLQSFHQKQIRKKTDLQTTQIVKAKCAASFSSKTIHNTTLHCPFHFYPFSL